ncbi:MAG: hypothetical protein BroJett040_16240 [Oligoflexia bacterium]|nr:MAG: hypothetical protein BroJett040_16240 [Oligoflexia bacterium]
MRSKFWPIVKSLTALGLFGFFILVISEYRLVVGERISSWEEDPLADCGVVLTGGPGRIREGFALLSRKQIKKLIISGVHPDARLREIMPQLPYYGDISEKDVILERHSATTYGNAQQSLSIVEALKCRDLVIVTSQIHMSRAYRTFQGAFESRIPLYKHAINSGRSESDIQYVWFEVFKSIFYSLWAY